MPRFFSCALVALLVLVALAPAAPIPQHLMKKPPVYYFPTKLGTRLTYEEPSRTLTMLVTAVADRGGAKIVTVEQVASDESTAPLMKIAVTGSGVYRVERAGRTLGSPEPWLLLPAEVDKRWEYPVGPYPMAPEPACVSVVGIEDVKVPAGTFRSVRVRHTENRRSVDCWYAPDVGLVKTEAATWTEVLKSFTPPKD